MAAGAGSRVEFRFRRTSMVEPDLQVFDRITFPLAVNRRNVLWPSVYPRQQWRKMVGVGRCPQIARLEPSAFVASSTGSRKLITIDGLACSLSKTPLVANRWAPNPPTTHKTAQTLRRQMLLESALGAPANAAPADGVSSAGDGTVTDTSGGGPAAEVPAAECVERVQNAGADSEREDIPLADCVHTPAQPSADVESVELAAGDIQFMGDVENRVPPLALSKRPPLIIADGDPAKEAEDVPGELAVATDGDGAEPGDAKQRAIPPVRHRMILSPFARENVASVGGAVSSIALGGLAIVGAFFTPLSAINSVLGLILGLWGLDSPRKRMALCGILMSVLGFVIALGMLFYRAN